MVKKVNEIIGDKSPSPKPEIIAMIEYAAIAVIMVIVSIIICNLTGMPL